MTITSNCCVCSNKLNGKQKMFCTTSCKNKKHQSYPAQKKRSLERKLFFINKLGGECSMCGYSKNIAALAFHRVRGKEFQLDVRALSNHNVERIVHEIERCILLCNNCHAQTHNPSLDLAKLLIEPTALTTELHPRNTNV